MKGYTSVLKLLVRNMLKKSGKEKKGLLIFSVVMLGILYLSLAAFIIYMIIGASGILVENNMQAEFLTIVFAVSCVAILVLGIIGMLNTLYFSRDTEFFFALPVSVSTVYFAKITVVYLTELVIEALILIPCIITMGVMMQMSALFYIVGFIVILTLPLLPLMLASIIAIPLMFIVSFFRNKGALTSIVIIILFGLIFTAYYLVVLSISNGMASGGEIVDIGALMLQLKEAFKTASNVLLPLSAAAKLATLTPVYGLGIGLSSLINAGIYVAFIVVLAIIAFLISSLVYKKGAAAMLEGSRSAKIEAKEYKASGSAVKALLMKEWRQLVRTPAFAFQCLSSLILTPIIVVVLNLSSNMAINGATDGTDVFGPQIFSMISFCMVMMLGVGMNVGACTAITREGEMFYYNKILPVDYADQIKAKKILYLIISYTAITVSIILAMIMSGSVWLLLLAYGFLLFYNYAFINFALYFDLSSPKLKWTTPNEAVKNNKSAMVPLFINMGVSFVLMLLGFGALMLAASGAWVLFVIYWAALYAVGITLAIVWHTILKNNAARLYERIEL